MRLQRPAWLLALLLLSNCRFAAIPLERGVQIDCRHFSRTTAGVWQADGNAAAVVNGRKWFLGTQQFTEAGPRVGGQDGTLLYDDLQRECAGGRSTPP